jgi:amino acid transporter
VGLAGILTLIGALIGAELSSALPPTGGVYVFLRELFGTPVAFPLGLGNVLGSFVAALVIVSTFGALNGIVLAGPRVYFAMPRDVAACSPERCIRNGSSLRCSRSASCSCGGDRPTRRSSECLPLAG